MQLLTILALMLVAPSSAFSLQPASQSSKWLREAEKKHARVALLALPTLAALGVSGVEEPVRWLSHQSVSTQIEFFCAAGLLESAFSLPRLKGGFQLKDGVAPGRYDALPTPTEALDKAEDALGRAAMVLAIGVLAAGGLA